MAKALKDVAPKVPLFEQHEKVKKEDLVDKEIEVIAYSKMESDDGEYGVMAFKINKTLQSCTINKIMLDRLEEAVDSIGLDDSKGAKKELYLKESLTTTIKKVESKKNSDRAYFVFE